jgi:uncharacterized Zn-finger protein
VALTSDLPPGDDGDGGAGSGEHEQEEALDETGPEGHQKYQCRNCGKQFKYANQFRAHKRIHEGEGTFNCGHCGKVFHQTAHLIRHTRIHTGRD